MIKLQFDSSHNVIPPTLVLSKRNGTKIGAIPATNIAVSDEFNAYTELTCSVSKYDNDAEYKYWDELKDFRCIYVPTWDEWLEAKVTVSETNALEKNLLCRSLCESELSQIMLYDVQINTEDDISRTDYETTVIYDEDNPAGSMLDRLLEKAPHYSIGYVDSRIAGMFRVFDFDNSSIYDAFQEISQECDCIFVFDSGSDETGKPKREINVYDLEAYCYECGNRGTFTLTCPKCGSTNIRHGYGDDTSIFVSVNNLAEEIEYETDVDSVKNCFKLEAGDDLMTATIISANPNGSAYIWFLTDEMRADMSSELVARLDSYDAQYEYYNSEYVLNIPSDMITAYNTLVQKYQTYDSSLNTIPSELVGFKSLISVYYDTIDLYLLLSSSLMPDITHADTTAAEQAALLTATNLSPVAVQNISTLSGLTANNSVLAMAKVIVDNRYQVKVNSASYGNGVWTGNFKVTNLSDEEDTSISNTTSITISDDYETFIKQKIDKSLKASSNEDGTDILSLLESTQAQLEVELPKWSLARLNAFYSACQACIDLLIEQNIADDSIWSQKTPNLYDEIYAPYYEKLNAIQAEITLRESEIALIAGTWGVDGSLVVDGIQTLLDKERELIHNALNFKDYIGEELWTEFASFRREDTYRNENYISDGLSNDELFEMANEFLVEANKEIYKSATLQHSISATLNNLLTMEEFAPLLDNFKVGNWIRIEVDGEIYRLRLLSYEIDFNNLDNLRITFSDVKKYRDGVSDSESIMSQAKSMASSYGAVTRQANKGKKSNDRLNDWVTDGLALTNMKIVSAADNQNITWDSHGILCREYLPVSDTYSEKQIKIINKGLYVTDDNWRTSKAGVGNFTFYNPKTGQEEEAYGVIAETLVGNLILSQEVGIYNTTGSVSIDENGIEIISDMTGDDPVPMHMSIGRIYLNSEGEEQTDRAIYIDSDGNVVISGNVKINSSEEYDIETVNDLCNPDSMHQYVERRVTDMSDLLNTQAATYYTELYGYSQEFLGYRDRMSQCVSIDENRGLVISGYNPATQDKSKFETVIDNESIKFKSDDTIVAYVNHELLYIPNAAITTTLRLGKFFVFPRNDDGVSIIWVGDYIPRTFNSNGELVLVENSGWEELVGSEGDGESSGESENNSESGSITYTGRPSKQEMLAMLEEIENQEVEGGD